MLDPIQSSVLEQARTRRVRVSGFEGSGKSLLARALAEDAARRGLSCLLVGNSPVLDAPGPTPQRRPPLHPTLAARASAPVPRPDAAPAPGLTADVAALRAALDPETAHLAARLKDMAAELLARHGLDADEIEAAAAGAPSDPRLLAALRVAAADARELADVTWDPGEGPRTLGEVEEVVSGRRPPPNQGYGALVLDRAPGAVDAYLAGLAETIPPEVRARPDLDALRRALDPWAWRSGLRTVADAHAWARRSADLLASAAGLLDRHAGFAGALADPEASADVSAALRVWQSRFPDIGWERAAETCRVAAGTHHAQAEAVAPFVEAHAGRALSGLHGQTATLPGLDGSPVALGELARRLRGAHHAARRLDEALADLADRLAPATWQALLAMELDALAGLDALPERDPERTAAARTLREIRDAYAATGFGDLLDPAAPPEPARLPDLPRAPAPGPDPAFLDLLLPPPAADAPETTSPEGLRRLREGDDTAALAPDYDVVVVDDEETLSDELIGAVSELSSVTHYIGVRPGEWDGFSLAIPHRQRDAVLANVASGREADPYWLGSPRGAGVVIRRLDERVPDLGLARDALVEALRAAGYEAAGYDADGPDLPWTPAALAVVSAGRANDALVRRACGFARDGVVVLCRDCSWQPLDLLRGGGDDAGLRAEGWNLVADVGEGRIFVRDGKSAVLVREPPWSEMAHETVAERVERLRGLGWNPVVDWIGRPRRPRDLARLLAASAVAPDPRMVLLMRGHILDQAPRPISAQGG